MLPSNQGDIRYATLWIPLILGVKVLHILMYPCLFDLGLFDGAKDHSESTNMGKPLHACIMLWDVNILY